MRAPCVSCDVGYSLRRHLCRVRFVLRASTMTTRILPLSDNDEAECGAGHYRVLAHSCDICVAGLADLM